MQKFKRTEVGVGIAPIGWTNDDDPNLGGDISFEQCVDEMRVAGYKYCEIGNKFPEDVKILKEELAARDLQVANAWYSTYFTTGEREKTIAGFIQHRDKLHYLGAKVIGVCEQGKSVQGQAIPLFSNKPIFDAAEWLLLCNGLNELAELAAQKNMKLCFHEHNGTGVQTNEETIKLMENTNKNVYLLLDTGHVFFSENSQSALEELCSLYVDRIIHVHLKDVNLKVRQEVIDNNLSFMDGVRKNMFVTPGKGDINFEPIFEILAKGGYQGVLLVEAEGDPAINVPLEVASAARKFIYKKTGV